MCWFVLACGVCDATNRFWVWQCYTEEGHLIRNHGQTVRFVCTHMLLSYTGIMSAVMGDLASASKQNEAHPPTMMEPILLEFATVSNDWPLHQDGSDVDSLVSWRCQTAGLSWGVMEQ